MTKDILIISSQEIFHGIYECFKNDNMTTVYFAELIPELSWKIQIHNYCLIVMEINEWKGISYKTITKIREQTAIPILALLEDGSVSDKVLLLKSGADDVLDKSFAMEECIARIKSLVRRYTELNHIIKNEKDIICYENLLIDTGRRCISINGKEISLPRKEYDILLYMLKNRSQTLTYEQIYEAVWKDVYLGDRSIIFYHMGELRRRIGSGWIESVRGIGYRLYDKAESGVVHKP